MPFGSPQLELGDLMKSIASGKLQLPDFQRAWKWDADQIRSLLASVSLDYPVGVIMTLEVGGDVRFRPQPIAGVAASAVMPAESLILDGQQRLTSLYQALYSGTAVDTKDPRGKKLGLWYYLDIAKCLGPSSNREDAVVGLPEPDRVLRTFHGDVVADCSSAANEYAAEMFPLARLFDYSAMQGWMMGYVNLFPEQTTVRLARWNQFFENVLNNLLHYKVPAIVLDKETPTEAVCTVFEKVNTGGIPLNVFELLTASFAARNSDFLLKDDWESRKAQLGAKRVLQSFESTDFLQAVALLATHERRRLHLQSGKDAESAPGVSCRKSDILNLTLEEYHRWADPVTNALVGASQFLAKEKIFQSSDLPYRSQLIPLAAIRVVLGARADHHGVAERLQRWFWGGVFGELYGWTTESRFARDLSEVVAWADGGPEPQTVSEAIFNPGRLLTLRTRNSAAYKGIYALLMREGSKDWMEDVAIDLATFEDLRLDIHHIFPKRWCKDRVSLGEQESIINKTAISARTNRVIGGQAPSKYLVDVEQKAQLTSKRLDEILRAHAIDPSTLRADDFHAFFESRKAALLEKLSSAMGKPTAPETAESPADYEDEPADLGDDPEP